MKEALGRLVNPVALAQLRVSLLDPSFSAACASLVGVCVAGALAALLCTPVDSSSPQAVFPEQIGRIYLAAVVSVAAFGVLVIGPARWCRAITAEKENDTYELLRATCLTAGQIVRGKLIAHQVEACLLLAALAPMAALALLFGGVEEHSIWQGFGLLLVLSAVANLVSIRVSAGAATSASAAATTLCILGGLGALAACCAPAGWVRRLEEVPLAAHLLAFLLAASLAWLYLAAVNRLGSAAANRSTPMRCFYLLFSAGLLLVATMHHARGSFAEVRWRPWAFGLFGAVALPALVFMVLFASEGPAPARERSRILWRLAFPGGPGGLALVCAWTVLLCAFLFVFFAVATEVPEAHRFGWGLLWTLASWLLAYLLAAGALTLAISTYVSCRRRIVALSVGLLALLAVGPPLGLKIGASWIDPGSPWGMKFLSPPYVVASLWEPRAENLHLVEIGGKKLTAQAVSLFVYLALAAVLGALAAARLQARNPAEEEPDA